MSDPKPDIKADKNPAKDKAPADRGESIGLMEPLLISESSKHRTARTDLAVELAARSAGFRRSLPPGVAAADVATPGVLFEIDRCDRAELDRAEVPG
jgi:hypothetical protein